MFTFVYKMKNPEGNGDQISNLPLYRHAGVVIGSLVNKKRQKGAIFRGIRTL